ncbi:hypothetical protein SFRURICE_019729 [Spodoptera frugiperda]|nr:hypothetical protein SFRURICE_019729 [Spodoptera frugiperda]
MGNPWPIAKPIASRPIPVQHQHLQHLLAHCHHPYLVRPAQAHTQVFPLPGGFPWAHSSRGKPRRGMMRRAVFSDLQRKGLEKRFQVQKYISKPDRKKLAEKLGLKDSQSFMSLGRAGLQYSGVFMVVSTVDPGAQELQWYRRWRQRDKPHTFIYHQTQKNNTTLILH